MEFSQHYVRRRQQKQWSTQVTMKPPAASGVCQTSAAHDKERGNPKPRSTLRPRHADDHSGDWHAPKQHSLPSTQQVLCLTAFCRAQIVFLVFHICSKPEVPAALAGYRASARNFGISCSNGATSRELLSRVQRMGTLLIEFLLQFQAFVVRLYCAKCFYDRIHPILHVPFAKRLRGH